MTETGSTGRATAIGLASGLPAPDAALVNGVTCHALDYDDTHTGAIAHVSVVGRPRPRSAARADARAPRAPTCSRRSWPATRSSRGWGWPRRLGFHARGFHPTAVCGVFGAAAAAGRLQSARRARRHERPRHRRQHVVGAARVPGRRLLDQAAAPWMGGARRRSSPRAWLAPRRDRSRLGVSRAASGSTGRSSARDDIDVEARSASLASAGRRRGSRSSRTRPVTSCTRSLDATAQAARPRLRSRRGHRGDPRAHHRRPASRSCSSRWPTSTGRAREYEAKFSLPVLDRVAARARARRRLDLHRRGDHRPRRAGAGGARSATRSRTTTPPRRVPRRRPHHAADGRTLEADFPYQRGGPENPMSAEEVQEKFRTNAGLALSHRRCRGTRGRGR